MRTPLSLALVVVVLSSVASAFSINPADDYLALWLDASVSGSVVTGVISGGMSYDAATFASGGGAAGDGQPVAWWRDLRTPGAGNLAGSHKNSLYYTANAFPVGPVSKCPTYVANAFRGHPALRLDGTDDGLVTWDGAMPVLTPDHTIIVVGRSSVSVNGTNGAYFSYGRYWGSETTVELAIYKDASGQHFRMREPSVDTFGSTATPLLSSVDMLVQRRGFNGTNYTDNGFIGKSATSPWLTATDSGTFSTATPGFRIGQHTSAGQYLTGDIMELIVYNRALSNTEIADLQMTLYAKWSIPEPATLALLGLAALPALRRRGRRG